MFCSLDRTNVEQIAPGAGSLFKKTIVTGKSGILNCSCDFIREINEVINVLHNLGFLLNLFVALGSFITVTSEKWTLLFMIPSSLCIPLAYAVWVWKPWQKAAKLEKPELQLSRISEGKKHTAKCLCYQLFLPVNNVNYKSLLSKASRIASQGWSHQAQLKCFCQHLNP